MKVQIVLLFSDFCDWLICESVFGGFLMSCPDQKLCQEIVRHLAPIQMCDNEPKEIVVATRAEKEIESYLSRIEKSLKDQGFNTKKANEANIKRLLGVYYEQNVTTEKYEDFDGQRWVIVGEMYIYEFAEE